MKPTTEFYELFQFIYDYFNEHLFKNELPNCMIIITRKNRTFGYYSPKRWVNKDSVEIDEIAINPMYFSKYPLIEILQTMGHEMCHLWQYHFGKSSKRTYHNKEWGNKMISIGLMPSNTGKVGGKITGQQMMEYPIIDGIFLKICTDLFKTTKFEKLWYDKTTNLKISTFVPEENPLHQEIINNTIKEDKNILELLYSIHEIEEQIFQNTSNESKSKYYCDLCNINIWGKPRLNIICGDCDQSFIEIN